MLKTLTKHAKSQKRIPILGQVRVVNGIAQTTDMDFWISVPLDLPDGMYYADGFDKGIQIKSDYPVVDFPEPKIEEKMIASTTLQLRHMQPLAWVSKASGKDNARYYLNGIYFDWSMEDGALVATNGHRLHSFKHVINAKRPKKTKKNQNNGKFKMITPPAGAIIPTLAIKIILELIKETKAQSVDIFFYGTTFRAFIGCDVILEGKLIDGVFPNWRHVVPSYPPDNKTIYDPAQIKALIQELKIRNKIIRGRELVTPVVISKGIARGVHAKHEWPVTIQWNIEVGFNVDYLADMCGGVMEYIDNKGPVKVTDRRGGIERTGVIMPIRVY